MKFIPLVVLLVSCGAPPEGLQYEAPLESESDTTEPEPEAPAVPLVCWAIDSEVYERLPDIEAPLAVAHLRWGVWWAIDAGCPNRIEMTDLPGDNDLVRIWIDTDGTATIRFARRHAPRMVYMTQAECYGSEGRNSVWLLHSSLVHELGHLFGLPHSDEDDSTIAMSVPHRFCSDRHPRLDEMLAARFDGVESVEVTEN